MTPSLRERIATMTQEEKQEHLTRSIHNFNMGWVRNDVAFWEMIGALQT